MLGTIVRERKVFTSKIEADRTAEVLEHDDEDGWTYHVRAASEGGYVIAIFDEDRAFVEYWT